jgi:hypothetical protein
VWKLVSDFKACRKINIYKIIVVPVFSRSVKLGHSSSGKKKDVIFENRVLIRFDLEGNNKGKRYCMLKPSFEQILNKTMHHMQWAPGMFPRG